MEIGQTVKEARSLSPEVSFRVKLFFPHCHYLSMLIGELAAASGLTREALRFYEQQGLLRARRLANGYRDYAPETLMLVNYIRTAQQLGFTLAEIGHKLPEIWEHAEPGPAITQVLQEKLHEIDARIIALQVLREDLATRLVQACPLTPQTLA